MARPRIMGPTPTKTREQFANGSTHGRSAYMDPHARRAVEDIALADLRKVAAHFRYLLETDTVKVDWVFVKVVYIVGQEYPETFPRREQDADWNMARLTLTAYGVRS